MPDEIDQSADQAFLAKQQAANDQAIAQAYLAANPDRAAAFGITPTPAAPAAPAATTPAAPAGPQPMSGLQRLATVTAGPAGLKSVVEDVARDAYNRIQATNKTFSTLDPNAREAQIHFALGAAMAQPDVAPVAGGEQSGILNQAVARVKKMLGYGDEGASVAEGASGAEPVTPPAEPAPAAGEAPVSSATDVARETQTPLYEMTRDQLEQARVESKARAQSDLNDFFGEEGAKHYQALLRQENSYNTAKADAAAAERQAMEEKLTPDQQQQLFNPSYHLPEDIGEYRRALGQIEGEDEAELGDSLKYALTKLSSAPEDPAHMNATQQLAYAQMQEALRIGQERGFDMQKVSDAAVKASASRFSDPEDARFMLDRFLKPRPAATETPAQAALTAPETKPGISLAQPPEAVPEDAAASLAQKQIDALKKARVGEAVATEFGKPEIATQVPEAQTLEEAKNLRQAVESPQTAEVKPPQMAAQTAALAQVYQEEAASLRQGAIDLQRRGAAGEDISGELDGLRNRFAAYAVNYANLAGARSEAGRALQILDPLKPGNLFAADTAKVAQELAADPSANLLDKLAALDPNRAATFARGIGEAAAEGRSITGMIREYYMNALLSKPSTFVAKKVSGDLTSWGLAAPTRWIAARIPAWGDAAPLAKEESGAFVHGSTEAFGDALRIAKLTFENGTSAVDALGGGSGSEFEAGLPMPAIRGDGSDDILNRGMDLLGHVIRTPTRAIQAETDFAYVMNFRGQLHSLAWRQATADALSQGLEGSAAGAFIQDRVADLASNPTPAMVDAAHSFAREQVFLQPLGPIAQTFNKALDQLPAGLGRLAFPFRKVPVNLAKYAIGYSPLSIATKSFWSDISEGGAAGQLALAKLGLGSAIATFAGRLALDGTVSGGGPSNPKDFHNQLATGWKPYSVHVPGEGYFTFDRMDPLGILLGMPADFMTVMGSMPQADVEHAAVALAVTLGRSFSHQSYVQTLANFNSLIDGIRGGSTMESALSRFGAQEVSGIIPAALRGEARREDPVVRDARGFMDTLLSSVPGYSKTLPPKRDLEGNPILIPPGFLANEVYPFQVGAEQNNPVAKEIATVGASVQKPPDILPGTGRRQTIFDPATSPDIGVPLDKYQKDRWQVLRASIADDEDGPMGQALRTLIADPEYKALAKEDKAKQIEKVVLSYGKAATQKLLEEDPALARTYAIRQQYKALGHLPPGQDPSQFLRENGIEPIISPEGQ